MGKKPNILLIQVDQLSSKALRLYGNRVVRTDAIDELANEGVLFKNAYCNYPACSPSRSSMMTGRYASTLRIHANHMLINPEEITLPLTLKRNGYKTALIGKNHAFMNGKQENYYPHCPADQEESMIYDGVKVNFDYCFVAAHMNIQNMEQNEEIGKSLKQAEKSWHLQHEFSKNPCDCKASITYNLASEMIRYLDEDTSADQPFFIWYSIPDPHTPYQVSAPYSEMYNPDEIDEPIRDTLEGKPEIQKVSYFLDHNHQYDAKHFKEMKAIYYGMITQIDDNLQRVFDKMKQMGVYDDTIIVFTSDHGDAMGDHGIIQKHNFFYDSFTKVPFIITWKNRIKPFETGQLTSLVDLMPTILDLADVEQPVSIQGKSLKPFLYGEVNHTNEFIVIESGEHGEPISLSQIMDEKGNIIKKGTEFAWCAFKEAWEGKGKCIRNERYKLCEYMNGEGELYDLLEDPDEVHNLYYNTAFSELRNDLRYKLLLWCFRSDDHIPLNRTVQLNLAQGYPYIQNEHQK